MSTTNPVPRIYRAVIDDVIKNVRESFLNEGIDEQVLLELKQLWESKLLQSRAIDFMPSDVNVRVSLTYPHVSQMQGLGGVDQAGQSQSSLQSSSHQPSSQAQPTSTPSGHLMQNQAGQIVYVSTHPTLGNVGPMSGAAAQAAMALQSGTDGRRSIIPQQVIQIQGDQNTPQQTTIYPAFQGRSSISGPRVIFSPAQLAQQQQQQSQAQLQQHVIQVDGTSDAPHEDTPPIIESTETKSYKNKSDNSCETLRGVKLPDELSDLVGSRKKKDIDFVLQIDGANDSSSDDLDGDDDDEDYDNYPIAPVSGAGANGDNAETPVEEEEPLNSEDDVSDDDPTDLFDTDNVVVCQYDKIARTRNRWKFHLKDGIMNLRSKDYVFHKANGDSEW